MLTVNLAPTHSDPEPGDLAEVHMALGGHWGKIRIPCHPGRTGPPAHRGPIKTFTRAARSRLIDRLAQIDREAVRELPLFITLTYPATWPSDTGVTKRHLQAFCKRLLRRHQHASIVWKLEYQARGAPHYHLLVWGVPFLPLRQVARDWYEIVGSGAANHLRAGTRIERVQSWRGVAYYAAKYLGKVSGEIADQSPGRFWGIINEEYLPVRLLVCLVSWRAAYWLRRVGWAMLRRRGYRTTHTAAWCGLRLFLGDGDLTRLLNAAIENTQPVPTNQNQERDSRKTGTK